MDIFKKINITLFKFYGTPVEVNPIFLLYIPLMGIKVTFILFIAILLHELGHSYIAHLKGYKTTNITISLLYGYARINDIKEKDDIAISLGGPLANLILALISMCLLLLMPDYDIFSYSLKVNLILLAFNILPISPLDGGRVLESIFKRNHIKIGISESKALSISYIIGMFLSISLTILFSFYGSFVMSIMFLFLGIVNFNKYIGLVRKSK